MAIPSGDRSPTKLFDWEAAFERSRDLTPGALLAEVDRLRARNRELNRRCQRAESLIIRARRRYRALNGMLAFEHRRAWEWANKMRKFAGMVRRGEG